MSATAAWTYLIVAGFFEVAFTTALRFVDGFDAASPRRCSSSARRRVSFPAEVDCGRAAGHRLRGGPGSARPARRSSLYFGEPATTLRLVFLVTLIGSIIGLKLFSTSRHSMTTFSPREIVSELDRYIVGQNDAKRAVAIALRNRWRRQQLEGELREEVLPKNILMIGPTGVGKTEISRRLARLAGAPFLKVEATKFTEVGYVGRDVESIVRDLVEVGIALVRDVRRKEVRAEKAAEERVLDALVGSGSSPATRASAAGCGRTSSTTRRSRSKSPTPAACRCSRSPACRRARWARSTSATCSARPSAPHAAPRHGEGQPRRPHRRGERQADRQRPDHGGGDQGRREQRHRVPRRDRQDRSRSEMGRLTGDVSREGCARSASAHRGHDGRHQARAGENGPRSVHSLGRVPPRQAVGPAAGAAGAAADPGRAAGADARRFPPHLDRARGEPHQAVRGADGDRGPRLSFTEDPSTRSPTRPCR